MTKDCLTVKAAPTGQASHLQTYHVLQDCLATQDIHFQLAEPLFRHCTWSIGGPAHVLAEPTDSTQLAALIRCATTHSVPWLVIGKGSNLLFDDRGVHGLVIKLDRRFAKVQIKDDHVTAQAGIAMPRLAHRVARAGLTGLEHTVGIPGSLGGLVTMNGGSLRQCIGDVIQSVTYVDGRGQLHTRSASACDFRYRHSWFQGHKAVVVDVSLQLSPGNSTSIMRAMRAILRSRRAKFPLERPNCGSVFKNSRRLYATAGPPGRAIESMGLKGKRVGDAEVSERHANFITNQGGATCHDTLTLMARIMTEAETQLGCSLEAEVRYVDPLGRTRPAHEAVSSRHQSSAISR